MLKRQFIKALLGLVIMGLYTKPLHAQGWEPISNAPEMGRADFVAVHPIDPNILYIGTKGNLYAYSNEQADWKRVLRIGKSENLNQIYFFDDQLYLLTSKGLYQSSAEGFRWRRVFRGRNRTERNVLDISAHPTQHDTLLLGTSGGLFESNDSGKNWQKVSNELSDQFIQSLEVDPENEEVFIASEKGLYRSLSNQDELSRVFSARTHREGEEPSEEISPTKNPSPHVRSIVLAQSPYETIAIGTKEGVYLSEDEGNYWTRLSTSGLRNLDIQDLVYVEREQTWIAATKKGVFFFNSMKHVWKELGTGLPFTEAYQLAIDGTAADTLYAATDRGIYQIRFDFGFGHPEVTYPASFHNWELLQELLIAEPTVREIQNAAVQYANVSNQKINRWQKQSRLKSLFPTFSVKRDFTVGNNVDLDRGSTSVPDVYISGPPDKTESIDMGVSWDLSELIFNSAQTSIDSREKLMVELRDEILSEVTRLYFERRRAQAEFVLRPPLDQIDQLNALFRLDELTANIDALTNGYLTKQLGGIYSQNPNYLELWQVTAT